LGDSIRLSDDEVESLWAGVHIVAARALGDPGAAEEVAQETLTRVLEALARGRLRDPANLPSFVRRIALNVIADHFRTKSRTISLDALRRVPTAHQSGPLRLLVAEEERERLRDALAELSGRDREILRLSYYEGLPPREIAARLGEPPPRIWKRKSRALKRLRAALAKRAPERGQESGPSPTLL
jgi:RNA polymerase sigma-70 factor (ECF subfamily)